MSDEIKEILSKMERLIVYGQYNAYYDLEKQLLDFITNLQKSQETLIKNDNEIITNLQEELKSANESITWWQNRFNALHKENKQYKEYIKELRDSLRSCHIKNNNLEQKVNKMMSTLKEEVSYLMPYEIYHDEVDSIVEKVEKIANGGDE